jgi:hypothetical protein
MYTLCGVDVCEFGGDAASVILAADEEHLIAVAAVIVGHDGDDDDFSPTEVGDRAVLLPYRPTMRVAERIDIILLLVVTNL